MGAEQSAPRGPDNQPDVTRKTCYYEVLGVERDAPDEEIRRAYKKKALELHPDRNLNDTANATRRFAEVQTAYEILSDPQERAWYDSHRDAILGGQDDFSGTARTDDYQGSHTPASAVFSLMRQFNSSVPMDDSPRGFFGILNAFFDQLAAEETAACEQAGITPTEYPPFGRANDDFNTVGRRFYAVWSSFSTKKTFSWRDVYRLQDAPDRQIRRLMQKDNKRHRDEGIREFNDAVLSLVAFVKKRDPRYVPNKQSEAERQQALRDSAAAQAARSRAAHQEKMGEYVLPEWAKSQGEEQGNDEFLSSEEESEVEEIECVVCNKTFKSDKQFEAHEKSKKHVKAVQQLRRQMRKENVNFELEDSDPSLSPLPAARRKSSDEQTEGFGDGDGGPEAEEPGDDETREPELPARDMSPEGTPAQSDTEDDDYAPRSAVEERILSGSSTARNRAVMVDGTGGAVDSAAASLDDLTLDHERENGQKIGKAKLRREKKAARQAAEAKSESHKCAVCNETFASRTKLFNHIKDLNHAAPVPVSNSKAAKKKRR